MMAEENVQGPKWLKELEEKRERRLKVRLGHEAGAGSRCFVCQERCPGLDLHFWRKICKNCKCGKESHDIDYNDDYGGWAQFQLLGSKPNKPKKIVFPGNKESVDLEWVPKGQNDAIQEYLKEVGLKSLPVKGTPAALKRKQLLHRQIPLHDIDPSFCHSLNDSEECKLNDYVQQIKTNSFGVGHIAKLDSLLRKRLVAHSLKDVSGNMKMVSQTVENVQIPLTLNANHFGDIHPLLGNDVDSLQKALEKIRAPSHPISNLVQVRQPVAIGASRDICYPTYDQIYDADNFESLLPKYTGKILIPDETTQSAAHFARIRDIYPDMNVNFDVSQNMSTKVAIAGQLRSHESFEKPCLTEAIRNVRDLAHSTYDPNLSNRNVIRQANVISDRNLSITNPNDNYDLQEQQVHPLSINVGLIKDLEYDTQVLPSHELSDAENADDSWATANSTAKAVKCEHCGLTLENNSVVVSIERNDSLWHANCFKCSLCDQQLADMMYFYDHTRAQIFCGRHYAKVQGIPRCKACDELIFGKEYCLAEDNTFHVKHFCCYECDEPLAGNNYVMEEDQPHCLSCFDNIKANRCHVCKEVIKSYQQGVQLGGVHIHADEACFICTVCSRVLFNTKLLFKNHLLYCSSECFKNSE